MASGTTPGRERRRYPRRQMTKAASVRIYRAYGAARGVESAYGYLRDFSGGGLGIDTVFGPLAEQLTPGEWYVIRLPEWIFGEELHIRCRLAHKSRPWWSVCGFEFEEPEPRPERVSAAQ